MTAQQETPAGKLLVLLLHGIRTDAVWQQRVRGEIIKSVPDAVVIPIKYDEYFDAFRFWFPVGTRSSAVRRVTKSIRDAVAQHPGRDLVIVAHSFGTYTVARALGNADVRPKRLLFAGSVVKQNFDWASFRGTIDVLNDCGSFDIWPILAKSTTWGYGASGTLGFGSSSATDRFFPFRHSDFFDRSKFPTFIEDHWIPWVVEGRKTESQFETNRPTAPWYLLILTTICQLKYVVPMALCLVLYLVGYMHGDVLATALRWKNVKDDSSGVSTVVPLTLMGVAVPVQRESLLNNVIDEMLLRKTEGHFDYVLLFESDTFSTQLSDPLFSINCNIDRAELEVAGVIENAALGTELGHVVVSPSRRTAKPVDIRSLEGELNVGQRMRLIVGVKIADPETISAGYTQLADSIELTRVK